MSRAKAYRESGAAIRVPEDLPRTPSWRLWAREKLRVTMPAIRAGMIAVQKQRAEDARRELEAERRVEVERRVEAIRRAHEEAIQRIDAEDPGRTVVASGIGE